MGRRKRPVLVCNTVKKEQTGYESATTFWAMWAGTATPRQASIMVQKPLPRFEVHGGLVSGTEESRGLVGINRPIDSGITHSVGHRRRSWLGQGR